MLYISHRVNTIKELLEMSPFGVEIDLRDDTNGRIYLEHEPFIGGEDFEEYLKCFRGSFMILNIKSERIEERVLELVKKYKIPFYFFLDSSFPMIHLLSEKGIHDIALRYSEFEGKDTLKNMAGRCGWIWVDCFSRLPLTYDNYIEFKDMGYRICIVSPELQGQSEKITEYGTYLLREKIIPDAVCTKQYNIPIWKKIFGEG